ncbi:MAG: MaoC family dehydratase N-terminal domain-containing protein [Deltaproteobacteria bacterium]|nr:MaoC family dehydratase N-terminal domain-containing protein [Deltaproteobacteria bacterium]
MPFDLSVVGKDFGPRALEYEWQRTALYALACGSGTEELDLLLESRGPKVLPTFAVVVAFEPMMEVLTALGGNMLTLLHASQKVVLHRPLPAEARVSTRARARAVYDKGRSAVAIFDTVTTGADGAPICETEWQIFYRGEGGFGGERGIEPAPHDPAPGRVPDAVLEMPTAPTQALLYRLASSDFNPIHADPVLAKRAAFAKPLLHGLCTFGHSARAAITTLCQRDPDRLLSIEGRFTKPVFPGETIITELFRGGDGEAFFVTRVKERPEPVISGGRVTFR